MRRLVVVLVLVAALSPGVSWGCLEGGVLNGADAGPVSVAGPLCFENLDRPWAHDTQRSRPTAFPGLSLHLDPRIFLHAPLDELVDASPHVMAGRVDLRAECDTLVSKDLCLFHVQKMRVGPLE